MLWDEMSSWDFNDAIEKCEGLCVLPIGVVEKHGDHLPVGTDMFTSIEIAKAAAEKSPAVVFPYYFMGQISEARHVKGTIAPSHKMIMDALLEMCDEIHRNGFTKILILSGHGGNYHFLPFFAQMFPGINRPYAVYVYSAHEMTSQQLADIKSRSGVEDMGGHAGFSETSLIMHLRPELVNLNRVNTVESASLGRLNEISEKGVYTGFSWYADFPHHFAGDPAGAAGEYGKMIFDILVNNTADAFNLIKADKTSHTLIHEFNSKVLQPD